LQQLVALEQFRKDLYYRLNEVTLGLPSLVERKADIPQLARTILDELGCSLPLTQDAIALLQRREWPGNLRELRSALKLAVLGAQGQSAIDARCFDIADVGLCADPSLAGPLPALPVAFPQTVCDEARRLWNEDECPTIPPLSAYERRALQRAAMIYLRVTRGREAFPAQLVQLWLTLFRRRWQSSEGERGLRDVMRVLGVMPSDVAVREWILGVVR
jgi:DNA-binding NtrC family response regulator